MIKTFVVALGLSIAMAGVASAQIQFVSFSMKRGKAEVKGTLALNGYSISQTRDMMSEFCKGGQLGEIAYVGKPRKRKGNVFQKFTTTCAGGPLDRFKGKKQQLRDPIHDRRRILRQTSGGDTHVGRVRKPCFVARNDPAVGVRAARYHPLRASREIRSARRRNGLPRSRRASRP